MPKFGEKSKAQLATCDILLQKLFNEVIKHYDCVVLEGHRGQAAQEAAFTAGNSKLKWPNGNHNKSPSFAVDVAPYPLDWNDSARFYHFAGFVKGIATTMGIEIRWGGDWDGDGNFKNQTFHDLPHFELRSASLTEQIVKPTTVKTNLLPDIPSEAHMKAVLDSVKK